MLRQTGSIVLAVLAAAGFCTACGGGSTSKSAQAQTAPPPQSRSPFASTPVETQPPGAVSSPGAWSESGTMGTGSVGTGMTGSTDLDRERVSGTETGEKQPVSGTTAPESRQPLETIPTPQLEAPKEVALTEPQIFAILTAANQHEIAVSKLALKNSKDKSIKKFANVMVSEHGKMLSEGQQLAKKLAITPEGNEDVKTLESDSEMAMEKLKGLKGAEFDRAYADQMVTDHQKVLDLIESKIGPAAASNPDLGQLVEGARPKVQMHLEEAKALRDHVSSK